MAPVALVVVSFVSASALTVLAVVTSRLKRRKRPHGDALLLSGDETTHIAEPATEPGASAPSDAASRAPAPEGDRASMSALPGGNGCARSKRPRLIGEDPAPSAQQEQQKQQSLLQQPQQQAGGGAFIAPRASSSSGSAFAAASSSSASLPGAGWATLPGLTSSQASVDSTEAAVSSLADPDHDSSEESSAESGRYAEPKSDRARLVDLWIEGALLISRDGKLDRRHFDRETRQNLKKIRPAAAQRVLAEIAERCWDSSQDIGKEVRRLVSHAKAQDKYATSGMTALMAPLASSLVPAAPAGAPAPPAAAAAGGAGAFAPAAAAAGSRGGP